MPIFVSSACVNAWIESLPWSMIRGTLIGSLCALVPGVEPTIASLVSYATKKKLSETPERFEYEAINS